jgi:hypothetical protein
MEDTADLVAGVDYPRDCHELSVTAGTVLD